MLERTPRLGRPRFPRGRFRKPTWNRMIPNILTVGALCSGLTAIRFAIIGRWDLAVFAIVVAGILDGLDGRMARLLNGTSKFGAELDSLSDFVSFGVAPAVIIYLWTLNGLGGLGWAVAMMFAVCSALRLARFNTALGDPDPPPWSSSYFTGVPAPAGAGLAILPLMAAIDFGPGWYASPVVCACVLVAVGLLMVSRIPTYSVKRLKVPQRYPLATLIVVGLVVASLFSVPYTTMMVAGVLYLLSIPLSIWTQRQARQAADAAQAEAQRSAAPAETTPANPA